VLVLAAGACCWCLLLVLAAGACCWCLLLLSLLQDIESQVEMMDQARHAVAGGPLSGFAYSGNFLWWDRDTNMDQQILQNVGLMLATAFVILVLFLPIALAATVAVLVTMVLLDLAGLVMTLWGVDLNVVSLMEIIMAVGFAVDCKHKPIFRVTPALT
jgi:hypothetical protein